MGTPKCRKFTDFVNGTWPSLKMSCSKNILLNYILLFRLVSEYGITIDYPP